MWIHRDLLRSVERTADHLRHRGRTGVAGQGSWAHPDEPRLRLREGARGEACVAQGHQYQRSRSPCLSPYGGSPSAVWTPRSTTAPPRPASRLSSCQGGCADPLSPSCPVLGRATEESFMDIPGREADSEACASKRIDGAIAPNGLSARQEQKVSRCTGPCFARNSSVTFACQVKRFDSSAKGRPPP